MTETTRPMADRKTDDIDPVWHALPVEQLLRHFELDPQRGLDAGAVRRAQARHGPNALPEAPPKPLWRTFARQFKSPLIYILFVAAVLAVALGHHGDAMVILAVVLVNALIGSFQEGRAERSMAALRRLCGAARAGAARRRRTRRRGARAGAGRYRAAGRG